MVAKSDPILSTRRAGRSSSPKGVTTNGTERKAHEQLQRSRITKSKSGTRRKTKEPQELKRTTNTKSKSGTQRKIRHADRLSQLPTAIDVPAPSVPSAPSPMPFMEESLLGMLLSGIDETYGEGTDIYRDVLRISPTLTTELAIKKAFVERMCELKDDLEKPEGDQQKIVTAKITKHKLEGLRTAWHIVLDPKLRSEYDSTELPYRNRASAMECAMQRKLDEDSSTPDASIDSDLTDNNVYGCFSSKKDLEETEVANNDGGGGGGGALMISRRYAESRDDDEEEVCGTNAYDCFSGNDFEEAKVDFAASSSQVLKAFKYLGSTTNQKMDSCAGAIASELNDLSVWALKLRKKSESKAKSKSTRRRRSSSSQKKSSSRSGSNKNNREQRESVPQ